MSHSHMSMGHSSQLPALTEFPKFYWAVVGSAIGVATLVNLYNHVLCRQRLAAARSGLLSPAKPKSWFTLVHATLFALARETSHYSIRIPLKNRAIRLPTVGRASLILGNITVLVVLCLYGLDLTTAIKREDVGFRCGVVTIAQLPLIFLLSGKNNIVGFLTGISYERLNWLHRWCARCMFLTATLHLGYELGSWAPYDYIPYQFKNNKLVWRGLAAYCVLAWIVFSSMAPIRGWSYEIFVLQHLVSFAVFLGFVYIHTPVEMNAYVWAPVAFFFFDRLFRTLRILYANVSIFHSRPQDGCARDGLFACKAEFTPLPHDTTRIVIQNPPISWTPGQHMFLSCHSIVPLQSHPFTVASIPEDGRMEFLVKAETGGTRRFFKHAEKVHGGSQTSTRSRTVAIEGPYGTHRPLRQFDSVILFAGSTGGTFTFPLLRDILQGWAENAGIEETPRKTSLFKRQTGAATRHVRFVWVVKSKGQLSWFSEQLWSISSQFEALQERLKDIKLDLTVYVTCDESFTKEHRSLLSGVTAPLARPSQKDPEHGNVEYLARSETDISVEKVNQEKHVEEITYVGSQQSDKIANGCRPNETCCCRKSIDETDPSQLQAPCCCSPASAKIRPRSSAATSSTPSRDPKQRYLVPPSISVISGRPRTRDIIRRSLELALGESAVVVCGPQGLVADIKRDVCSLSDERAVHKGTGAQGIYLHTESFKY